MSARLRKVVNTVRMVKKIEKGSHRERGNSVTGIQPASEADGESRLSDNYVCTGKFADDFTELCRRKQLVRIPAVVQRPLRPYQVPVVNESKLEKAAKNKGSQVSIVHAPPPPQPAEDVESTGQEVDLWSESDWALDASEDPSEQPAKTYTTVDTSDYSRPKVHVVQDHPDKGETVSEIFIQGWKLDAMMLDVLEKSMTRLDRLHTLHLHNVGLTAESMEPLSRLLGECANLRNLFLEGNPIPEENFHVLLGEKSNIINLSLRNNRLTDKGAASIAHQLSTIRAQPTASGTMANYAPYENTKLLQLNLANNDIGDQGARALARALRMNRTLLSISLAGNQLGDEGVAALAEVLSRFTLTRDEVITRRQMQWDKFEASSQDMPGSRREGRPRPESQRSNTHHPGDKGKRDKSSKRKDGKEDASTSKTVKGGTKKDEKPLKKGASNANVAADKTHSGAGTEDPKKNAKTVDKGGKRTTKDRKSPMTLSESGTPTQESKMAMHEVVHPFMEDDVEVTDTGEILVPGNRTLISLNVARNRITDKGASKLLLAIQYQKTLSSLLQRGGPGLMRLVTNGNLVDQEHEVMKKLRLQMTARDPINRLETASPSK